MSERMLTPVDFARVLDFNVANFCQPLWKFNAYLQLWNTCSYIEVSHVVCLPTKNGTETIQL